MDNSDYINKQKETERTNAIQENRNWINPLIAGIGTIGLGALLLRSRLANGGRLSDNLFNFLGIVKGINLEGDIAANTGKSAIRGNTTGLRSLLDFSYDFNKKQVNLGPIDVIDDLRNSIELMGLNASNNRQAIADAIAKRTTEYTNRALANYGNNVGFFPQSLQRVTFGDILSDQKNWSRVLGGEQYGIIEKAQKLGLIKSDQILDSKIYLHAGRKEILDTRLRNLVSTVTPIEINGKILYQRTAKFDMFGQGQVIGSLFRSPRNIAVLGPGDGYDGSRVFIGGNVYGYSRNAATGKYTETLLGTGRSLRKTGNPFEVIDASRQGRLEVGLPTRSGFFGGILSWMEQNLGIGPAFSTRSTLIEKLVINPYKRLKALQEGQAVIFHNPYKHNFAVSKVLDSVLGGDLPELAKAGGGYIKIPAGGRLSRLQDLSGTTKLIPNRVGVLFDIVDDISIIKRRSYAEYSRNIRSALISDDLAIPIKKGSYEITGKTIPGNSMVNLMTDIDKGDLTAVGFPTVSNRYAYYDIEGGSKLKRLAMGVRDMATYGLHRLNSLMSESLLGIGMKPDHSFVKNLIRSSLVPVAYETARQAGLYADYLTEKFTGISPIKAAASVYAGARIVQQYARQITGIGPAADFLDTYFPGSINSDGSTVLRSIGAPILAANAVFKRGGFLKGLLAAAGTYAAIGGPDPGQSPTELMEEYSGDRKVPVRKGRLWGLGYLPFFGGKPDRFESSWYNKLTSDYRTKSLYGDKSEYWSYHANVFGVPFPTPSNLFGLLNILNPYRLEEKHYSDRPYVSTESGLSRFPIFGPLLGGTIGQLLKPTQYREPDRLPMLEAGLAQRGLTANTAKLFGMPAMAATSYEAEDPATLLNTMAKQANIASEPLGIYKFAMEFFGAKFSPDLGTQYATSAMMQDPGRLLYDSAVNGLFGQTELIRRYMLSDYSSEYRRSAMVNPILNNLPGWLPGSNSTGARDRDYFIDFHMGDPFVKIADGEARLPGAGYEALNKLHSGRAGEYSDVDKFLILSDVAPYSSAYKKYEKIVLNMQLEDEWKEKVDQAIQNRSEVIGVDTRYKRYEEDIIALNMNTIAKSIYAPIRKAYDFLTHDVLAEIPYVGSKFFPFRSPYEQYRKMYVEGSEYASWNSPWEDIVRPALYDTALEDPITAAGKGATFGFLLSGPMRWFTPIKAIVGHAGGSMVNMAAVKGGALIGAGLSTARIGLMGDQDSIPYHIRQENDAIEYMDTIGYIKGRMIQEAGGGPQFADRTMLGAKNTIGYRASLPRSADRKYFDYFVSQEDPEIRAQILRGLPDFMTRGLSQTWAGNFNSREQSDEVALDFVNNNQIPDTSWLGWNPEISNAATRLRFIEHGINGVSDNIHRYGFYESHEVDLKTRLKEFGNQEINFIQSPLYSNFDSFIMEQNYKVSKGNFKIKRFSTPNRSNRYLEAEYTLDKTREIKERLR